MSFAEDEEKECAQCAARACDPGAGRGRPPADGKKKKKSAGSIPERAAG